MSCSGRFRGACRPAVTRRSRRASRRGLAHPGVVDHRARRHACASRSRPLRDGVIRGDAPLCARTAAYQVEIVASGTVGSTVLANFPVYCGVAPPAVAPRARRRAARSRSRPRRPRGQMLALINRDRKRAGVPPVVAGRQAGGGRARPHARHGRPRLRRPHVAAHRAPRWTACAARAWRRRSCSENVGRAYTAEEAEQGFMSSPGHRANIVDPRPRARSASASCSARPSPAPRRCS